MLNIKLSSSDVFERLKVKPFERFEIIGYENNPYQIIKRDNYYELVNCNDKVVHMNTLQSIMLQPHLVKKLNQNENIYKGEEGMNKNFITTINCDFGEYDKQLENIRRILGVKRAYSYPKIEKIIYNMKNPDKPATIVYFTDGDKVVVKCTDKDTFTKENGVAMALIRKMMPNRSKFLRLVESGFVQE